MHKVLLSGVLCWLLLVKHTDTCLSCLFVGNFLKQNSVYMELDNMRPHLRSTVLDQNYVLYSVF